MPAASVVLEDNTTVCLQSTTAAVGLVTRMVWPGDRLVENNACHASWQSSTMNIEKSHCIKSQNAASQMPLMRQQSRSTAHGSVQAQVFHKYTSNSRCGIVAVEQVVLAQTVTTHTCWAGSPSWKSICRLTYFYSSGFAAM
jgi:hypothetical protein